MFSAGREGWVWAEHLDSVPLAVGLSTAQADAACSPQPMLRGKRLLPRIPRSPDRAATHSDPGDVNYEMFIRALPCSLP